MPADTTGWCIGNVGQAHRQAMDTAVRIEWYCFQELRNPANVGRAEHSLPGVKQGIQHGFERWRTAVG